MSYQVEVLPVTAHPLYDTRESGKTHTPFSLERALCTAIELGDEAAMDRAIADYMAHGFVVGTMSGDRLRQVKYWAVATVAIAIHYAILGGLDETDAYHLSDAYLREVDRLDTMDACIDCLRRRATELVRAVASAKSGTLLSPPVRRCVHYIHIHLHEKMPCLCWRLRRGCLRIIWACDLSGRWVCPCTLTFCSSGCKRRCPCSWTAPAVAALPMIWASRTRAIISPLFASSTAAPRRSTGGFTRTDFIGQTVGAGLYFQTVQYLYCLMGDSDV